MKFRTEYEAYPSSELQLQPRSPILFLGSCFSDNIGTRLKEMSMPVTVNPCGVLYNPASIANILRLAIEGGDPLLHENGNLADTDGNPLHFSWDFSTRFSRHNRSEAAAAIAEGLDMVRVALRQEAVLAVTFGTSIIYSLSESIPGSLRDSRVTEGYGRVVGNCHKFPAAYFNRSAMSVESIVAMWERLIEELRGICPGIKVIATVSPVRHLAEGFAANARSKARLLLACGMLEEKGLLTYFPAYEIMNDDLRDYRFYADDLLHPSPQGVEYILEKFTATFMDEKARQALRLAEKAYRRSQHRPIIK